MRRRHRAVTPVVRQACLRHALLMLSALVLGTPAWAQGISLGGGSGSELHGVILEEQDVVARVADSFSREVQRTLDAMKSGRGEDVPEAVYRELVDSRTAEFLQAVRAALTRLAGDGVLHAKEVADELAPLRSERLEELATAIDAVARGHEPPPVERHFESRIDFARALVVYTFTERNSPRSFMALVGTVIAGLVLVWLLRRLFNWVSTVWQVPRWLRVAERTLKGPLYLGAASLGVVSGLGWIWVPGLAVGTVQEITSTLLILVGFWVLWNLCDLVGGGVTSAAEQVVGHRLGTHRRLIVRRCLRVVVVASFLIVVIHTILDSNLTGLLAGLGVVGLALSFALRGTIENIAASFTIFGDGPFEVDDILDLDGTWGRVEDIGFRSTRVRTFDNHLITVPNTRLIDGAVHNVGARGAIRRRFRIGLVYDTPAEKIREAMAIIEAALDDPEHLCGDSPPHVVFEAFGDYDLRLLVQYHYQPPDYWEALAFDTEVNLKILEGFRNAEIEMAYPTVAAELHGDGALLGAHGDRADASRDDAREEDAGAPREPASRGDAGGREDDGDADGR